MSAAQEAGDLKSGQKQQLANARNSLMAKMQQLVGRRRDIARLVQSGGPETASNQQPLLGNMAQVPRQLLKSHETADQCKRLSMCPKRSYLFP